MVAVLLVLLARSQPAIAQAPSRTAADSALALRLDAMVPRFLTATGTPSASIAVVRDGALVLTRAWGMARLDPQVPATPDMRYAIGSISKQFCAAALLMLQQEGKVSLDDRVARYLPNVPHGNEVSIRQLLSQTAGYEDYWPQNYVPPHMRAAATVSQIMAEWAGRPLAFKPGDQWQYSNTNYVIAGAIVEVVSGLPLYRFLQTRVFEPLRMTSVVDYDASTFPPSDAEGYLRNALGPLHRAPSEANAWLFAAADLAMTAKDLARWDLSIISRSLLDSASYVEQETPVRRSDGGTTGYGLGVELSPRAGHRAVSHRGGVSGFTATNLVFPNDRAAVVVLTNGDTGTPDGVIADLIALSLFAPTLRLDSLRDRLPVAPQFAETLSARPESVRARRVLEDLQHGTLDRSRLTDNANANLTAQALAEIAASLTPLGPLTYLWKVSEEPLGAMSARRYTAWFPRQSLRVSTLELPDGRFEQYSVEPIAPMPRPR